MLFNLVTGALMVLLIKAATMTVEPQPRRVPWVAVTLTALVVAGLVLQASWGGAMAALDSDPSRAGWWRPLTSVFMQNGGPVGNTFNVLTLAFLAAFAQWRWGGTLTAVLFACGMLLPEGLELLVGGGPSTDPRNFAGSSGATYFLGATLAGALLLAGPGVSPRLFALTVPALGLVTWFAQNNGHGLVATEGFLAGAVVVLAAKPFGRSRALARAAGPWERGFSAKKISVVRRAARPCPDGSTSGTA